MQTSERVKEYERYSSEIYAFPATDGCRDRNHAAIAPAMVW